MKDYERGRIEHEHEMIVFRLAIHNRNREAVIPFAAYGLNGGRGNPFFLCQQFKETTHANDVGVFILGIGNRTLTDYVIGDDESAGARQFQRPNEVIGGVHLVRVDKDEIEWCDSFGSKYGQKI